MGILIKPIVTEKLTAETEKYNRYGFIVDREANKLQIKAAVEQFYNVTVKDVNTVNYHGKRKSRYSKAGMLAAAPITSRRHTLPLQVMTRSISTVTFKEGQGNGNQKIQADYSWYQEQGYQRIR